jgi:nicotinamide-nucleotide amidase
MKATIVTIGDEILIGQIVDSNSAFIAKSLDKIGIEVYEMLSISDSREHILQTLSKFQDTVDLVVLTGGLGPTKDDITKKTFCDYFEDSLVLDQIVLDHVTELIEKYFNRKITQLNKDQALVPSQATVLHNQYGTAPGLWVKKGNTVFVSLPGVPFEMKYLIENSVIPKLVTEFERPYILHKTILTYGQGESLVAERIESWEDSLPDFLKLAYLPSLGKLRLRITARGTDKKLLENAISDYVVSLDAIIHDIIVGFEEEETIEAVLGGLLSKRNQTIATAESCTGGKIAEMIASISGASQYYNGSIVAYSNEVKIKVLGIPEALILKHTVVSAEVAKAMALNVKNLLGADYAIATTGNAGPTKGEQSVAVGTVFIALATPTKVIVEEFNFGQPREKVIDRASVKGLEMVLKEISQKEL